MNSSKDMLYLTIDEIRASVFTLAGPFLKSPHFLQGLQNLALPLLYVGRYPEPEDLQDFDPSELPEYSPWLASDVSEWLAELPSLQTLYLVVNHLFSVPFGAAGRRITRSPRAGAAAENSTAGRGVLVASRSKLRDLAASQPRDCYGFSDYNTFIAQWQWPIKFPQVLMPLIPAPSSPVPLNGHGPGTFGRGRNEYGFLPGLGGVEMPFERYDRFVKQVLSELHRVLALTHPSLVSNEENGDNNKAINIRLVVDLDSNANGIDPLKKLAEDGYMSEVGYDRHFCIEGCSVSDWYTDISGHDRNVKGFEDDAEAKRNESDPEFDAKDLDLDNLSDGSGPDSEYELPLKKAKTNKNKVKGKGRRQR
ncbi:hypothetical protein PGQ11_010402 [Apiospora arundinis]|uniref:Uncharacterized protein n=1 Tax=Apiospora arundinis TaxID=335852 RepID=A0ABR2I9J1_9PEZI